MAALALAVFWIHVLLIAAAAGQDLIELARLRRSLRPLTSPREAWVGLLRATVVRGDGPAGALASNVVEQVGRGKGDGKLYFSDAAHRSELHGGEIELADGVRVELVATDAAGVWPDLAARAAAAAPSSSAQITEAEPQARRAKGYPRRVEVELVEGQPVWIAGRWTHADRWQVEPGLAGGLLISAIDPRRWLARKCWIIVSFIVGEIVIAAACTLAATWPPLFDWVSMLGAGAALGFFLAVQPVGVSLNESVRTPDRAYLRGSWTRTP
ncbi:hypothetical protein ENSA7_08060 [Enhygromyxa salina]|uniref:Uncharacterized protein n=2 Tax=Enhygromyxa salina TaxID=215803 RepID=A0A2S9YWJ7_9BACT|nr:hypothetical protein ENSA7_08060 [Enhygromyxa salina]